MQTALTVSAKGQVVIPAELRAELGISPGSVVEAQRVGNGVLISLVQSRPKTDAAAGFGLLKYRGEPRRLRDLDVVKLMRTVAKK